jgi:hypothetical protein
MFAANDVSVGRSDSIKLVHNAVWMKVLLSMRGFRWISERMEEGWSCWNGGEGGRKTEKQTRKKRKRCKVKMVDVGSCRGRFRNA